MIVKLAQMPLREALPESREGWVLNPLAKVGEGFKGADFSKQGEGLEMLKMAIAQAGEDCPTEFLFGTGENNNARGEFPVVWSCQTWGWQGLKLICSPDRENKQTRVVFNGFRVGIWPTWKAAKAFVNSLLPTL
jgi:hypothetical protein